MNRNEHSMFETARDELFGHVHRCGVLRASVTEQEAWMEDTIGYIGECHPELTEMQLDELRTMGLRFCQPVIRNLAPAESEADELAMAS